MILRVQMKFVQSRPKHKSVALMMLLLCLLVLNPQAGQASDDQSDANSPTNRKPLDVIISAVIANPDLKPLTRKALSPKDRKGPLQFYGQDSLTKPLLEAYLDRAIVHMSASSYPPSLWKERSRKFLNDTGAKFIHWADIGWVRRYAPENWTKLTDQIDAVHNTDYGADVLFECGVMEAVGKIQIDSTPIPKWLLTVLTDTGIQDKRKIGPNGKEFFSYEAMFDRNAEDWPKKYVGLWNADPAFEQSVPDLTMLETQIYYAYLIAEYIDSGFEGVMFGQTMLTGARDKDNAALNSICNFARRWAAARGYRKAVTLTSHVNRNTDYPKSNGKPIFTHITWPSRLSVRNDEPLVLQFGPDVKAKGHRQSGEQIVGLLKLDHDLPILLEIDNYSRRNGPSAVCDEGYDEITGYAVQSPEQRSEFLKHYYFECRKWRDKDGNARVHLAMPGHRCLNVPVSLYTLENGEPSPPTSFYWPYKEEGGEEETIKELFQKARMPGEFAK